MGETFNSLSAISNKIIKHTQTIRRHHSYTMMTLLSLKVLKSSKIQEPKYLESETCFVQIKKNNLLHIKNFIIAKVAFN